MTSHPDHLRQPTSSIAVRSLLASRGLGMPRFRVAESPKEVAGILRCPGSLPALRVRAFHDPLFGPMVTLAPGGALSALGGESWRVAPISRHDARDLLEELPAAAMLEGSEDHPPSDGDALVDLLLAVAGAEGIVLPAEGEALIELELDPVFALPSGLLVGGARIAPAFGHHHTPEAPDPDELAEVMRVVFAPRSMAVVGVSASDPQQLGYRAVRNLVEFGYPGRLYPIHPRAAEICGLRAYPRLSDVPEPVERAIVTVPRDAILDVVDQCVATGVRVMHSYTAGFGEVSREGRELEKRMLARAAGSRLRFLGPNSIGTYVPAGGITLISGASRESGSLSVVSQSGSIMYDMVRRGCHLGLRINKLISIGNSIDLDPADFLEHFAWDPGTRVIGAYIESVHDGRRLRGALEEAARQGKPVIALKGGQTDSGRRAAAGHTGAPASDPAPWHGLFSQCGVSQVRTARELVDTLLAFQMLPPMAGPGVALIGPGGGVNVSSSDMAEGHGLVVPPLAPETLASLVALQLPPGTSLVNPLDLPAGVLRVQEGRVLGQVLACAVADPGVSALVVHLGLISMLGLGPIEVTGEYVRNMVSAVIELKGRTDRPVCLVLRSSGEREQDDLAREERARALEGGVPVYAEVEDALVALGHLYGYHSFVRRRAEDRSQS